MDSFRSYRNNLPHFRAENATYFVTWRLHPSAVFMSDIERTIVADALKFFHGERYDLCSYVVMDDHVHLIVRPKSKWNLEHLIRSWKTFTARKINARRSRSGSFWMSEYKDRMLRNDMEFREKTTYLLDNPARRWPNLAHYPWAESLQL